MRYAVVIEKADRNYSAYVPDLPGCVATGATIEEVERELLDAIRFHIRGLEQDGLPLPEPTSRAEYVDLQLSTCVARIALGSDAPGCRGSSIRIRRRG